MPYRLLVHAQDRADGKRQKGYIITVRRPGPWTATGEVLPKVIKVTVSDGATWEQAHAYTQEWIIDYIFTVLQDEPTFAQYKIEVDSIYVAASGKGANELKAEMNNYIVGAGSGTLWYGSTVDSFTPVSMIVTVPKPHVRKELKDDFTDKFQEVLELDRYYFEESAVDWAIAQGGEVTITQAQLLSYLVDRLAVE